MEIQKKYGLSIDIQISTNDNSLGDYCFFFLILI